MSCDERVQVSVWTTDGYEGRFLEWNDGCWQAYDYRNFRHWFSAPQPLTAEDVLVLRRKYKVESRLLSDPQIARTPPEALERLDIAPV